MYGGVRGGNGLRRRWRWSEVGREVRVARRSLGRGRVFLNAWMGWREESGGRNKVGKDGRGEWKNLGGDGLSEYK